MIINYITTAWRNLRNSKFYSFLNIIGLSLGLTVGLFILLWVRNELSYDAFNSKADQLYRMTIHLESSGTKFAAPVVQAAIVSHALKDVSGIQNAVRVTEANDFQNIQYNNTPLKSTLMVYTDPSLFSMFDYKLIKGSVDNPFPDVHSIIITESAAIRFFGDADPINKVLVADKKENFTVSGVVADFPSNGWLNCDILFSIDVLKKLYVERGWSQLDNDWGNYGWAVFLQLQTGTSPKTIEDKLTQINVSHQPNMKPVDAGSYGLQALRDLHLYAADGTPTGIQTIKIFSIVAVLILVIASINYVNLSTARAMMRSKEVSVRKIIGASRIQLFLQFVIQTIMFFSISLVIALGAMYLTMPLFNTLSGITLHFNLLDPAVWQVIGLTMLFTLLMSAIYPALLLSSFHPVAALRGKMFGGIGGASFRKMLVIGQFTFSVGLIICTVIISRQLSFMRDKSLGYDKSFVFSVPMGDMHLHYESEKAELLKNSSIEAVTSASTSIVNVSGSTLDISWDGKDPNSSFFIHALGIDKDFMALFKTELVSGISFTGSLTDSLHFILNETAILQAGIKDPIGKRLKFHGTEGTIIGVVKDFHFASLKQKIEPFLFYCQKVNPRLFVKVKGENASEAIQVVENIWKKNNNDAPFEYVFLDETYSRLYKSDQRIGSLFSLFTGIAIVISCLGLLGLATYTAQIKIKEISIRKVLGASVASITVLLSRDFVVLIGISIVIAVPLSWYAMESWLKNFAYRTELPWWVFALSGALAILIAVATISFQSIRAALENPVKSLR